MVPIMWKSNTKPWFIMVSKGVFNMFNIRGEGITSSEIKLKRMIKDDQSFLTPAIIMLPSKSIQCKPHIPREDHGELNIHRNLNLFDIRGVP